MLWKKKSKLIKRGGQVFVDVGKSIFSGLDRNSEFVRFTMKDGRKYAPSVMLYHRDNNAFGVRIDEPRHLRSLASFIMSFEIRDDLGHGERQITVNRFTGKRVRKDVDVEILTVGDLYRFKFFSAVLDHVDSVFRLDSVTYKPSLNSKLLFNRILNFVEV